MPELPDVEVFKNYFDSHALNKTIKEVEIKNATMLETSGSALSKKLVGQKFKATRRIGKYLLAETDRKDWMTLHFGMTGYLASYSDKEDVPDYSQVILHFDGDNLSVISKRKLGKVGFSFGVEKFMEEKNLGPDALSLHPDRFKELTRRKKGSLKTAFMDQCFIAGLGNVYTDEVLYQAKLHPKKQVADLTEKQIDSLYDVMRNILETCIKKEADPGKFPGQFLTPNRKDGADCPGCSGKIKKLTVGGRGTYICPACQNL